MHEKEHSRKPLALLGFYLRGHERTLFGALLFALVSSNLLMIDPLILRHVLDQYVLRRSDFSPNGFLLRVHFLAVADSCGSVAWVGSSRFSDPVRLQPGPSESAIRFTAMA